MSQSRPDGDSLRGVFIDANLLVLLVGGTLDPAIIGRHRRLRTFGPEDFERVQGVVSEFKHVLVTPNTLTEASNLLGQHREPERSRLLAMLGVLIHESPEIVIASTEAADHPAFPRLGLTDAGLLRLVSRKTPLVTVDLDLYLAASKDDAYSAFNFWHYRQRVRLPHRL